MISPASPSPYSKDSFERKHFLDGLRGWASLMVLLSHSMIYLLSSYAPYRAVYLSFFNDGTLAVYIFFVVSGFALSTGYFQQHERRLLYAMALRRYPRLTIPIFLSSLVAFLLMKTGLIYNFPAGALNRNEWLEHFYAFTPSLANFLSFSFLDVYFSPQGISYNENLWTMYFEFTGSFLIFFILWVGKRTYVRRTLYALVALPLFLAHNPMMAMLAGMILAELYQSARFRRFRNSAWAPFCAAGLVAGGIACSLFLRQFYGDPRWLTAFALLLFIGAISSKKIIGFLENRLSAFLGRISFPLYLIQMPLICSLSSYMYIQFLALGMSEAVTSHLMLASNIVICMAGAMIFDPVERLSIQASRRFSGFIMARWPFTA